MTIEKVKSIMKTIMIEKLSIELQEADYEKKLLELGLNSLLFIKLLINMEKELDVEFPEEIIDPNGVTNLNQLAQIVLSM
ncbi:phosphopantetheine-binding protein [[Clostridium] polysaccharolyticum]|uniref:Phosphopantetheine attachment site n=1 Tax=[Clostridium] polysaccharolyticum TaxID=29364 RepID=A0A1I0C5T5_9FIRM|nr:phosphopantetheine-binding protein [[Clostridium] polysaccharolyticum]SET14111.1 Phosphopantetheine attachment site [[Clostridium] polysaccharolyticum]